MTSVIVFTNDVGGVSVCIPTGELSIEETQAKDCPENSYIVDASSIPQENNDFFDAWEQTNGVVTVNIFKAKAITKARLRVEREPLLAAQDVLFQRAQENGSSTIAIVAEKKRLRDITLLADNAETLDDLRAIKC